MKMNIVVKLELEGLHHWPNCPLPEVAYLKDLHRHIFHIVAKKEVMHSDRDVEIIMFKKLLKVYLVKQYWDTDYKCCNFRTLSCEAIAEELLTTFKLTFCSVLEDNENGAEITN